VSELAASAFTSVRLAGDRPQVTSAKVAFTRVRPGDSLLDRANSVTTTAPA
ncbi:MAG: hypothetical protein HZC06_01215, partial [Methylocystis sp.]|nr:hypothetical protein [Methylocystis sp.]